MTSRSVRAAVLLVLGGIGVALVAHAIDFDDEAVTAKGVAADETLTLVQHIALPSVNGRIDHLAVDHEQQRLYVAALGNNTMEVIDLRAGTRTQSVTGLHEPQGIAVAPELKRVVIANGEGGEVQIRDAADPRLAVQHTVPLSDDADNVRYDAAAKRWPCRLPSQELSPRPTSQMPTS